MLKQEPRRAYAAPYLDDGVYRFKVGYIYAEYGYSDDDCRPEDIHPRRPFKVVARTTKTISFVLLNAYDFEVAVDLACPTAKIYRAKIKIDDWNPELRIANGVLYPYESIFPKIHGCHIFYDAYHVVPDTVNV